MDIRAIQSLALGGLPSLGSQPGPSTPDATAPVRAGRVEPTSAERAQFKKAATEFESFFLYYMLKTMRQAIPKGGLLSSKVGDTYMGLLDQEVANQAAKQGGFGLGKSLETQMFPPAPRHLSFLEIPPKSTEEEGP